MAAIVPRGTKGGGQGRSDGSDGWILGVDRVEREIGAGWVVIGIMGIRVRRGNGQSAGNLAGGWRRSIGQGIVPRGTFSANLVELVTARGV